MRLPKGSIILSGFNMQVALSTALLAVVAAVAAPMASHAANEAALEQIQASDQWSFYQSKSIKENMLSTKLALIVAMGQDNRRCRCQKVVRVQNRDGRN